MALGIYCYIDRKYNKIVYIGKDSNIDTQARHKDHCCSSHYHRQQINRVLQRNPTRYMYQVLNWNVMNQNQLNALEIQYIRQLKPKFNFTNGGDGSQYWKGKKRSIKTKNKISKTKKNYPTKYWKGKKRSIETKNKISNTISSQNTTTGFYRVSKQWDSTCKQGFIWRYTYRTNNKQRKVATSVDLLKLKKKVESQGLPWRIIDKNKAQKTLDSIKL